MGIVCTILLPLKLKIISHGLNMEGNVFSKKYCLLLPQPSVHVGLPNLSTWLMGGNTSTVYYYQLLVLSMIDTVMIKRLLKPEIIFIW